MEHLQKNNVLNSYFVKLGWFWTCVVVCPFIWYISTAIGQSISGASFNSFLISSRNLTIFSHFGHFPFLLLKYSERYMRL